MHLACSPPIKRNLRLSILLFTLLAVGATGLLPATIFAQNQSGITSPANGDSVSGDVIITGTAVIEPFLRYELYYKLEPNGDDAYIYFDGGTSQIINGQLGIWRTANLAPGSYSIRLRVVKADGNYGEFIVANLNLNLSATQEEPTATATSSEPTPTPIPTATFTPAPQPTPIVGQVTQPEFPGQASTPSPILAPTSAVNSGESITGTVGNDASAITFEESANAAGSTISGESSSVTRQLGEAVALDRLRQYFVTGMQFSAMLILGIVALMAGKRIFTWVWTQYR